MAEALEVYESNTRYNALYSTEENQETIESWGYPYSLLMGGMVWVVVEEGNTVIQWVLNDADFQARFSIEGSASAGS